MYELVFKDKKVSISRNHDKTYEEIRKYFSGEEQGFIKLLEREKIRFEKAFNCLKKDYSSIWKLFNLDLIRFIPWLSFPKSMYEELGNYFKSDELKISFTFQSKYIGMSPWDCPAAYMIIPYIEHNFGIYHVKGGLSEISEAMKRVFLNTKVNYY
jgi:phytoene desaturase